MAANVGIRVAVEVAISITASFAACVILYDIHSGYDGHARLRWLRILGYSLIARLSLAKACWKSLFLSSTTVCVRHASVKIVKGVA